MMDTDAPDLAPVLITVRFNDGRPDETVRVCFVGIDRFFRMVELAGNEPRLIEYVLGKPNGWARGLKMSSHAALADAVTTVNAHEVMAWIHRLKHREAVFTDIAKTILSNKRPGGPLSEN